MSNGQVPQAVIEKRFGGKSAMENHVRWHVGRRCKKCHQAGVALFQVYAPKEEYLQKHYEEACAIVAKHGRLPEMDMVFGGEPAKFVLIDRFSACGACLKECEREVAHVPSWYPVWIEWGPDSGKVAVAMGGR